MWVKRNEELNSIQEVFMKNIGVNSLDDINNWFTKSYACGYRIDGIEDAVKFVSNYKDTKITIVGDYDADGITSTSILFLALKWYGFKCIKYRIPKRFSEGFGISETIIDEIDDGLVLTCDNGVAQYEAIKKAKDKNLAVVIIDHHEPRIENGAKLLPPADIIIDPNAIDNSADFNGYCGAGLSLRFARALFEYNGFDKQLYLKLVGLAAIGTVADVMVLREENYVIVKNGLKYLLNDKLNTIGTNALIKACDCKGSLSARDIGFKIGPVINAASRMNDDGAKNVVDLLIMESNFPYAISKAETLLEINEQRKTAKKNGMVEAKKLIAEECLYGDIPLVINVPDIGEGIIGILAGNLCEEYKIPAIVFTETEDGILKGSARSCGNCNIKEELDKCSDLLLRYGGHEGAAGLSIKLENLKELRTRLCINISKFFENEEMSNENIHYDLEINSKDIEKTINVLKRFEPFGEGNPNIVFKIKDFEVLPRYGQYKTFIGDGSIVKLYSANSVAIGFNMADAINAYDKPKNVDLIGIISENYFNGSTTKQIEFSEFIVNKTDMVETSLASKLKILATT